MRLVSNHTGSSSDPSSKCRRMNHATTPESVGVQRYVGTSTTSPLRQSPNREEIDEAGVEDSQSQSHRPLTPDAAYCMSITTTTLHHPHLNASKIVAKLQPNHPTYNLSCRCFKSTLIVSN